MVWGSWVDCGTKRISFMPVQNHCESLSPRPQQGFEGQEVISFQNLVFSVLLSLKRCRCYYKNKFSLLVGVLLCLNKESFLIKPQLITIFHLLGLDYHPKMYCYVHFFVLLSLSSCCATASIPLQREYYPKVMTSVVTAALPCIRSKHCKHNLLFSQTA